MKTEDEGKGDIAGPESPVGSSDDGREEGGRYRKRMEPRRRGRFRRADDRRKNG